MSVAGINVLVDETRARQVGTRAPLLTVRGVKTYYGNIIALKGSISTSTRVRSSR